MKKAICIMIAAVLYFQTFDYVDLSTYQSKTIEVEIKGEVMQPSTYTLPHRSSIKALLKKAKGAKEGADMGALNLNQTLHDKDVIVIQALSEVKKISLNAATVEQLKTLPGIGPSMAQRIVDYRKNNTFKTLEDIMNVKGIKEKLYKKMEALIVL